MFINKSTAAFAITRSLVRLLASRPSVTPSSAQNTHGAAVFGLEEQDFDLNFAQGLYTDGAPPTKPRPTKIEVTEPPETFPIPETAKQAKNTRIVTDDKYSTWFTSTGDSATSSVPKPTYEGVILPEERKEWTRNTGFGTVRLDNDNPPQPGDDTLDDGPPNSEFPDYRAEQWEARSRRGRGRDRNEEEEPSELQGARGLPEWLRNKQPQSPIAPPPAEPEVPAFKMPKIVTKPGATEEKAGKTTPAVKETKENAPLKKAPAPEVAAVAKVPNPKPETVKESKIPSAYILIDYNNITHQDMWNILQKQIIYDNDFLLAINKPPGVPIHSPALACRHTLIEFLPEMAALTGCDKVYPLHRLDKETTGVLLLAKTEEAAVIIKKKFADRQITKKYLGITKNCPEIDEGSIKIPISEGEIYRTTTFRATLHPDLSRYNLKTDTAGAREAVTHFKIISSREHYAFVEITPETGVKHQIRVHLGFGIGCPIVGDHKYSHRDKMAPQRLTPAMLYKMKVEQSKVRHLPLHLHCSNISFTMPDSYSTTNVFVHARPPQYFMRTLKTLGLKS